MTVNIYIYMTKYFTDRHIIILFIIICVLITSITISIIQNECLPISDYYIPATVDTIKWGYFHKDIKPILRIDSGQTVTIETLTHHCGDDYERMIRGDANVEKIFHWRNKKDKTIDCRGAGSKYDMKKGSCEGMGVHLITGPIHINGAEPGDVIRVDILSIVPRPCANSEYIGKYFGSNLAANWGFQYDLLEEKKEIVTIYEINPKKNIATMCYNYKWKPMTDPSGIYHETYNYPGMITDLSTVDKNTNVNKNLKINLRPHFGLLGVTPNNDHRVSSIPPSYFGGNMDNWRATTGASIYLPVEIPGAGFVVGDPHACQGDGELCGTAIEFSLTGTFRFTLIKKSNITFPIIETNKEWVLQGYTYSDYLKQVHNPQKNIFKVSSLDKAMRDIYYKTEKFLIDKNLSQDEAISVMSVGVDFGITQIVNGNWGIHAIIQKSIFSDEK